MDTTIRKKMFLLLVAIFITGLFITVLPTVSYGDAAVDVPAESNSSSSSSGGDTNSSSSNNNYKSPAQNNTYNNNYKRPAQSSQNNYYKRPAQNNNYNNNYKSPAQNNTYNNNYTPPAQSNQNNYSYTPPASGSNAKPTNITAVDYYAMVNVKGSAAGGDSVSGINFRANAGAGYDTVEDIVIPNGTVLHITKTARAGDGGLWGYTEYKGKKGWIFLGLTKKVKKPKKKGKKAVIPKNSTIVDYYVKVNTSGRGMFIRSGPGDQYDKLQRKIVPNGTVLHISRTAKAENGRKWGYTKYNNMNGWVYLKKAEVTSAPVRDIDTAQKKSVKKSTKSDVKENSSDSSDSDESISGQFLNKNSNMSFMMKMLIMALIALMVLALIITAVVLLTRRNDRR